MKQQSLVLLATYLLKCYASSVEKQQEEGAKVEVAENTSSGWSLFGWWSTPSTVVAPSNNDVAEEVVEEAIVEVKPSEDTVVEVKPAEETIVEVEPSEESVVEVKPAEETIVEVKPTEESVVEEKPAEETVVAEVPVVEEPVKAVETTTESSAPSSWFFSPSYWFSGSSNNNTEVKNEKESIVESEPSAEVTVREVPEEIKAETIVEEQPENVAPLKEESEEKEKVSEVQSESVSETNEEAESVSYFWRLLGYGAGNKDTPSRIPVENKPEDEKVIITESQKQEENVEGAEVELKVQSTETNELVEKAIERKEEQEEEEETLAEAQVHVDMQLDEADRIIMSDDEEPNPQFVPVEEEADPTLRYLFNENEIAPIESDSQEEVELKGLFEDIKFDKFEKIQSPSLMAHALEMSNFFEALDRMFGGDSEELGLDFLFNVPVPANDHANVTTTPEQVDSSEESSEEETFLVNERFLSHNRYHLLRNHFF